MGRDKALVEVDGVAMALRVADALRNGGCTAVRCQGGDVEALSELGLESVPEPGVPGEIGPVGAIVAALSGTSAPTTVVAACDLPGLDGACVAAVVEASSASGRVAVAVSDGHLHLVSAWPGSVVGEVSALAGDGVVSYRGLLAGLDAVEVEVPSAAVRNVNLPDDLDPATA
jgi:molybdopterin-guanine dinucleotide biosynthesis protein A